MKFAISKFSLFLFFLGVIVKCEKIQVHMVVSSHLDAGWVSTFDEYYTGTNTPHGENVQKLYTDLIPALEGNNERTYTVSDIAFFARWWREQDAIMQKRVKSLISNGQIEFVNGGWVANDEATVYYEDIIENFRLGNRWLNELFGVTPRIGWQVDSFGTSATHAALLAQTGYEALYFSRLDYLDRRYRIGNQSLEFMWRPKSPRKESIFTHIFSANYGNVVYSSRSRTVTDFFEREYFSDADYKEIIQFVEREKKSFKTSSLMLAFCEDFYLPSGDYLKIENLADHFKNLNGSGFELKISTISQLTHDIMSSIDLKTIQTKKGDFFPYVDVHADSWVGFYTSKPMFKRLVRATSHHTQAMRIFAAKIIFWRTTETEEFELVSKRLTDLQEVTSILQHHDAITGTMKEYVKYDYEDMIAKAVKELHRSLHSSFEKYLQNTFNEKPILNTVNTEFTNQFIKNEGVITFEDLSSSPDGTYTLAIFNPGTQKNSLIKAKLPETNGKKITILTSTQQMIEPDIICLPTANETKECWIYFMDTLGHFDVKLYKIQKIEEEIDIIVPAKLEKKSILKIFNNADLEIKEDFSHLVYRHCPTKDQFDNFNSYPHNCTKSNLEIQYGFYKTQAPSGAYVINIEKNSNLTMLPPARGINAFIGKHVTLLQMQRDNIDSYLLFESLNTELPGFQVFTKIYGVTEAERGREFLLRIKDLEIKNEGKFSVDQNGYYMAERVYGQKDGLGPSNRQKLTQNIYPMTAMSYIKDKSKRLTIITDRPQGVASTENGEIEVMLHRTTLTDDNLGVDEPLYEKSRETNMPINVTTSHYILFTDESDLTSIARKLQVQQDRPLQYWTYKSSNKDFSSSEQTMKKELDKVAINPFLKIGILTTSLDEIYLTLHNVNEREKQYFNICEITSGKSAILDLICPECNNSISNIQETTWNTLIQKNKTYCGCPLKFLPMEIRTFKLQLGEPEETNQSPQCNPQEEIDEPLDEIDQTDIDDYVISKEPSQILSRVLILGLVIYILIGIVFLREAIKQNNTKFSNGKIWMNALFYIVITVSWIFFVIYNCLKGKRNGQSDQNIVDQSGRFNIIPSFFLKNYEKVEDDQTEQIDQIDQDI